MDQEFVATIMKRHYIEEGVFVFSCSHVVTGTMDEETGYLVDCYGNEYESIKSPKLLKSSNPYGYYQLTAITDSKDQTKTVLEEVEYLVEYNSSNRGKIVIITIDDDDIINYGEFDINQLGNNLSTPSIEELLSEGDEEEDEINPKLREIVLNAVNQKYSISEIKSMRDTLKVRYQELEWAIDSLELHLGPEENPSEVSEEQTSDNDSENYIDIEKLFQQVTKTLIAQDEPARRVMVEIARKELADRKKKRGILLTGTTGVGKTLLMQLIARYLDRPFYKIDSPQLTSAGYAGRDIEEALWDLYVECGKDVTKAEKAIIFFDEIDKKGSSKKDDHSGQRVLNSLLAFIEGATYDACENMKTAKTKVKIDTSNMIVFAGGSFSDVYRSLREKNIGFDRQVSSKPIYRPATTEDFVKKGMMTDEFMGRVTVIKLNDLDIDDIKRVMLESDESELKVQEAIFEKLGVKITFTDDYITEIARNAYSKGTGLRGIDDVVDGTTWRALDEVMTHRGEYEEVILADKTVNDPENYQLVKRKEVS